MEDVRIRKRFPFPVFAFHQHGTITVIIKGICLSIIIIVTYLSFSVLGGFAVEFYYALRFPRRSFFVHFPAVLGRVLFDKLTISIIQP